MAVYASKSSKYASTATAGKTGAANAAKAATVEKITVAAAKPSPAPVIGTAKNPALFPTAPGGAMEGKILVGNSGTIPEGGAAAAAANTFVDKYTNLSQPGETALQEAARLQAQGTMTIFNKVSDAIGAPRMVVSDVTGKNTETAKAAIITPTIIKNQISPVLGSAIESGSAPALIGGLGFAANSPFDVGNLFNLPKLPALPQVDPRTIPVVVTDIPAYLADQTKIADATEKSSSWFDGIDLTPGFNLGISDGSLATELKKTVNEIIAIPTQAVAAITQTTAAAKKTTAAISTGTLVLAGVVAYLLLKKK